jgi:glc operon protein GlcG
MKLAVAIVGAVIALGTLCMGDAQAQMIDRKVLSIAEAKKIAAAAMAEAQKNNWNVVVAILDEGGHLMYLERRDGTQLASADIAINKAKGALYFRRSSKVLEEAAAQRPGFQSLNREVAMVEGGLLLQYQGGVVGAIGVSGVTSQQDGQIAQTGVDALK